MAAGSLLNAKEPAGKPQHHKIATHLTGFCETFALRNFWLPFAAEHSGKPPHENGEDWGHYHAEYR